LEDPSVPRIFVSQQRMQQWTEDGKVSVENNVMILPTLGKSFRLTEAVHITKVVSDGGDAHRLIGRVKTLEQLKQLGAETYHGSVVIEDTAYECEHGFVGEVIAGQTSGSGLHKLDS
jgi:hypothetical protein